MNHSSAWEALAKRFSTLPPELDFSLWGYSVTHPPTGVELQTLRRVWYTAGLSFNTDYTSLAIQGPNPLTSSQFLALNRLEWFAWAAGTLLRPNSDRPERDWFIHVFRESNARIERGEHHGRLDSLSERCAEVATGQAGIIRPPEQRFAPPPAGPWQEPFKTLHVAFQQFALQDFDFLLDLHGNTKQSFGVDPKLQRFQENLLCSQRYVDTHASDDISLAIDSRLAKSLRDLFEQSARNLPTFLTLPISLFPSGSSHFPLKRNPNHLLDWFIFLWLANPQSFQTCIEPDDDGARKAVWQGGNPSMASVLAIDQLVRAYSAETIPTIAHRLIGICPWLASEEKPVVMNAITAAFQEPEQKRVAAPVDPGSYTVQDILDLLIFRRMLPEFERQRDAHFPPVLPPGGTYDRIAFSLANRPKEGRLTEADAAKLSAYRKLVRVARQEYHTDLDETVFRCVAAEVLDAAGVPADNAWAMTVDDFGTLWERTLKGRTSQDDMRIGADDSAADSLTRIPPTADANPASGAVAVDPHVERYFAQFDERMRPVQALWERAMRATPGALEVNGRQSIPLTTREAWDAFMAAFEFEFGTNGTTVENCNRLLRDAVFPPPGWDERSWRALAQSVGANPDDAGTGAGRTRITDAAMTAANAARLQWFAGASVAIPPAAPAPVAEPIPATDADERVPEADEPDGSDLDEREVGILIEMHAMGATFERNRETQEAIVARCQKGANADTWKRTFSLLRQRGYIDSKTGPKGGCWLTRVGNRVAERLRNQI